MGRSASCLIDLFYSPNITGSLFQLSSGLGLKTGAFSDSYINQQNWTSMVGNDQHEIRLNFNALKSNAIYGKTQTVQTTSLRVLGIIRF